MTEDWRALNRAAWDERVAIHLGPRGYDIASLRTGQGRLNAIEEAELGPVAGLRVLHLQCHFGRDSLILASRGADVSGIDFSPAAIDAAKALAAELGANARFILSDLYDAPSSLLEPASFDLVYITWGTICWLPDIAAWARIIAHFLRPGGALYFADAHPVAYVFDDRQDTDRPGWHVPYFGAQANTFEDPGDYIDRQARRVHVREINWLHPLDSILAALRDAGLQLDWLHEHPRVTWQMLPSLVEDADGCWTWPDRPWFPLSLSLRAVRSA